MYTLEELEKHPVFKNFISLTKIPRPSYHEKEASDFLVEFASSHNLEVLQDKANNVVIRKKASEGYEGHPGVIIQGHIDMVPEKTQSSNHDFLKDPLKLRVKDNNLYATDTTLGADNGIAVAMAMAVLEDNTLKHPAIEVLVTTAEEVGMDGAVALDASLLKGKKLLNVDSEEEGIFFVSCAGGNVLKVKFKPQMEKAEGRALKIKVTGFKGGHSGMEIIKQRGNAIKILGRILSLIEVEKIASLKGGAKHNAIAREAEAVVLVKDEEKARTIIEEFTKSLKDEYMEDKDLKVEVETESVTDAMDMVTSKNIVNYMAIMPDGVMTMMKAMENMVETSLNVGVLNFENGEVEFTHAIRSSLKSRKKEVTETIMHLAEITGAETSVFSDYPEWQYDPSSELLKKVQEVYKEVSGKEPLVTAVHAGLECGILKEKMQDVEMISFGPDMADVHTPNEHLSIESTLRTWEFLKKLLESL